MDELEFLDIQDEQEAGVDMLRKIVNIDVFLNVSRETLVINGEEFLITEKIIDESDRI